MYMRKRKCDDGDGDGNTYIQNFIRNTSQIMYGNDLHS